MIKEENELRHHVMSLVDVEKIGDALAIGQKIVVFGFRLERKEAIRL